MQLLKWSVCGATLSGMAVAPNLWINRESFPAIPAFAWVPALPDPVCMILSFLLVCAIVVVAFHPEPKLLCLFPPGLGLLLALFDASRMQPWFYEYSLMFAALTLVRRENEDAQRSRQAWAICAIVVIGFYFWAGLQKANPVFATQVFPWLLQPLPTALATRLSSLWFLAPVAETAIALLLFFPKSRTCGIGLAIVMNALVLLALGPLGQNYDSIVWPWNLWLAIFAVLLFMRENSPVLPLAWSATAGKVVVTLVLILPVLSFFNLWDGFLSSSYYSGKLRDGWIYLNPEGRERLPAAMVRGNSGLVQESEDRYRLDILLWAMSTMNAPPYGEPRYYPGLVKRLEALGVPRKDMLLVVQDPVSLSSGKRSVSSVPVPYGARVLPSQHWRIQVLLLPSEIHRSFHSRQERPSLPA
jgi:hypothetical protein